MPRFLLELEATNAAERQGALRLATRRFPEVALELAFTTRGDEGGREVWVCRAPSPNHLRRWADAAGLTAVALRRIDGQTGLFGSSPASGPR